MMLGTVRPTRHRTAARVSRGTTCAHERQVVREERQPRVGVLSRVLGQTLGFWAAVRDEA